MRFLSYLATLLFVVLLAACGGGGGSPGATAGDRVLFTTAPGSLTLTVGSAQEFNLGGGRPGYFAVSTNATVAVAAVSDTKLTIGAVSPGAAEISVRDSAGATTVISVTVTAPVLFSTSPPTVTLPIGPAGAQTYRIGGAGPFTATSSNIAVVTAALGPDNTLVLTGVAAGAANVVLRDKFGTTITIPVTVATGSNLPLFTSAPPSVTIAIGGSASYLVGGGAPAYMATSSNTNVATVSIAGGNLTVIGVAAGSANILIRDSAGASLTLAVTIGGGTLTVNPSGATALIGDVLIAKVTGGRAPYSAVVSNVAVADATISFDGTLQVTVKQQAANVPILISDADGLTTSFALSSSVGQPSIQLSPSSLTISELSTDPIALRVYGGNGAVTAFSSDTSMLSAIVSGNTVTVSTGSKGNRCVGVDTPVTISVVDSTGALATSVITIKNSTSLVCP